MSTRRIALRTPLVSLRLEVRVLLVLAAMLVVAVAAFTVELARGEFPVPVADVLGALVGAGDEATSFVVLDLRLPRALCAILAGAAFGVAGAIFQEVSRNALVSPDIVGVSTGASLAAISLIVFGDTDGAVSVPVVAVAGGLVTGTALYALAWRGGVQGLRLVLVGIGLAAMLHAAINYVLTRGQILEVAQAYVWMVGSLNGRGWEHVWPLAVTLAVLLPVALALGRQLGALQLGDDVARALGAGVERARLALLATAIVLTAVAVSAVGPIAFVAFVAPHLARRLGGSVAPSAVLPVSAAAGATLVALSDVVGRELFAPTEIPVGLITSILAAPYFLFLLRRANRLGVTG